MTDPLIQKRLLLTYLTCYLFLAAIAVRAIPFYFETSSRWLVIGAMGAYMALFSVEWLLAKRIPHFRSAYFVVQIGITLGLLEADPPFDFFCVLLVPLSVQAFWYYRAKTAAWISGVAMFLASIVLLDEFGILEALGYILAYSAVLCFIAFICVTTLRAEQADRESKALLAELRAAHRKLQDYAARVEELAATEERNRLARELHDSVTQTIFSLTLTAQAARILLDRDPKRLSAQLDRLQALAQSALAEMRSLIQQYHPRPVAQEGLAAALRRHAGERKAKEGLEVELQVKGECGLPVETQKELFRVIQEALNNVVKHAQTDRARVILNFEANPNVILIEDDGVGFNPARPGQAESGLASSSHIGLSSMAERAQALGGKLVIDSKPGAGTRIRVEVIQVKEYEHA